MSFPSFPLPSPELYRWEEYQDDPPTVQRLANGTEHLVGVRDTNKTALYNFYINTSIRICSPEIITLQVLKERLVPGLVDLRFQHPDIACTALWEETGPPLIRYTAPRNDTEVIAWANQQIETIVTPKDGISLRAELEKNPGIEPSKSDRPVHIFLLSPHSELCSETKIDVLVHFNHLYWDAFSARTFVGDLLRQLEKPWNGHESSSGHPWGEEIKNLSCPVLDATKSDVTTLGPELETTRTELLTAFWGMLTCWGLKVHNNPGTPQTVFRTFTVAESTAIIKAVKDRLGPDHTISHLAHATVVSALLKANPIPQGSDVQKLVTPLPVNGRRYLTEKYANNQYGVCLAAAAVVIDDLDSWAIDNDDSKSVIEVLNKGCRHVKKSYDYWIAKEFQIPMNTTKDSVLADFLVSVPNLPPPTSTIPAFFSDGIVDKFIPDQIQDPQGKVLAKVDHVAFMLNVHRSSVMIRMESWKGATSLAMSFNDGKYDATDAAAFLDHMAGYMLAFASA